MTAALQRPLDLASRLTLAWVRVYCLGMPEERRGLRRLEIESDLWEHRYDSEADGEAPALVSADILGRLLRGIPSDIAWRVQAEGFHMNINVPVERFVGVMLLFLIIPFIAGASIAGYDTSPSQWPGEFQRFSDIDSNHRNITAFLHGLLGVLVIAGAAMTYTMIGARSPRLIGLGTALLFAAGIIMLISAATYRAISALADDYALQPENELLVTARTLMVALEGLAFANFATTLLGMLTTGSALVRLRIVPRWTRWVPIAGAAVAVLGVAGSRALGQEGEWLAWGVATMTLFLWFVICGLWLLLGGSQRMEAGPAAPAPA